MARYPLLPEELLNPALRVAATSSGFPCPLSETGALTAKAREVMELGKATERVQIGAWSCGEQYERLWTCCAGPCSGVGVLQSRPGTTRR